MRTLTTPVPPFLMRLDGEWWLEIAFNIDGEGYSVLAPIGDGRYHAEQVLKLVVMPAVAPKPLDPPMVEGREKEL